MTVSLYFLATTTVPIQMFMFPLYFVMAKLGLINSPVADLMAVATIIALPTLVFFVLVQRRFIEGVSAGYEGARAVPPHSNGEVAA